MKSMNIIDEMTCGNHVSSIKFSEFVKKKWSILVYSDDVIPLAGQGKGEIKFISQK